GVSVPRRRRPRPTEPLAFYCNKKRSSWKDVRTSRTGREDNICDYQILEGSEG
ncbi:hypothetical protein KUCAC02_016734, partial [Chaenocephalus aceratus]